MQKGEFLTSALGAGGVGVAVGGKDRIIKILK